jgi:hypothetical protein
MKQRLISRLFRRALPGVLCAALAAGGAVAQSPKTTPPPATPLIATDDAVRFLEQATFGPTSGLIGRVQEFGVKGYLEQEFSTPMTPFPDLPVFPSDSSVGCPTGSDPNCFRDNYTMYPLQVRFFLNALYADDQLRQRVAFALHQIFVVSGVAIEQPSSMSPYLNVLVRNAFGNFRQLLWDMTLNPAMGDYLDMVNNDRSSPNENYAREVLQLFSIGLYKLNPDGTLQLDTQGQPIPTYDQNTIIAFARMFTGWTYAPLPGANSHWTNSANYLAPMVAFDNHHDRTSKTLLNGVVSPANLPAKKDLVFALDNIFNHPNVGPFICKQLIQHLVTSNPSPAYVGRVTSAFNNNGAGVRGDMKTVIIAILTDSEARCDDPATCAARTDVNYGHLREPVLFITNVLRAFNASSDGISLVDRGKTMGQEVLMSPSVFNYYRPGYIVPGTTVLGPEFTIQSSSSAINRANFVNTMVFSRIDVTGSTGTQINLSGMQGLSQSDSTGGLLADELNRLLMHNTMSSLMRARILQTIAALPSATAADHLKRAQWVIYLVLSSSQYQVAR